MPNDLPKDAFTVITCPKCNQLANNMIPIEANLPQILLLHKEGFTIRQISFELDHLDDEVEKLINEHADAK
jgi:hypothetical protein